MSIKNKVEIFEYKEYPNHYKILFIILGILTWAVLYNYTYLFDRKLYLNRKRLLLYIKRNPLGALNNPSDDRICYEWIINPYSKTCFKLYYWKEDSDFSLHKDDKCLISSFHCGYSDNKIYNELKAILETNIEQFKKEHEVINI